MIDVKPDQRYLNFLKSRLSGLSIKDLKELKNQVVKYPKEFKPFLLDAIKQLLNAWQCFKRMLLYVYLKKRGFIMFLKVFTIVLNVLFWYVMIDGFIKYVLPLVL